MALGFLVRKLKYSTCFHLFIFILGTRLRDERVRGNCGKTWRLSPCMNFLKPSERENTHSSFFRRNISITPRATATVKMRANTIRDYVDPSMYVDERFVMLPVYLDLFITA